MGDLDLDALARLARDATPGEWHATTHRDFGATIVADGWCVAECQARGHGQAQRDASYIAAAHPAAVLALVERARRAEAALADRAAAYRAMTDALGEALGLSEPVRDLGHALGAIDDLRAALAEARRERDEARTRLAHAEADAEQALCYVEQERDAAVARAERAEAGCIHCRSEPSALPPCPCAHAPCVHDANQAFKDRDALRSDLATARAERDETLSSLRKTIHAWSEGVKRKADVEADALAEALRWIAEHPDVGDSLTAPQREIAIQQRARAALTARGKR